jgi:2-hydroxychromene-2-carboxylate isomerase
MGELIVLADRLADRSRPRRGQAAFFFDLASPFSYLASERVERVVGTVEWIPVCAAQPLSERARAAAESQAEALHIPLVWPEGEAPVLIAATRAAAFAAEAGRAAPFALAAARLAFCGGFDLNDPAILADAAAAAGLSPREVLEAAESPRYDMQLRATTEGLRRRGVRELPAIRVGEHWCAGQRAVGEAGALIRAVSAAGA